MRDEELITALVAWLASGRAPGLHVDRWPDKEQRDSSDIDAVAGRFAIEHTSIDTFPEQRQRNAWLQRMLDQLEQELITHEHLQVILDYDAVKPGQDWSATRAALKSWLETDGQRLTAGRSRIQVPGVPFWIDVVKMGRQPPRVRFGRYVPPAPALSARLKALCDRKIAKLARYKTNAMTTLLLLETDDIHSMNDSVLADAVREAYPAGRPAPIDEIWYANTAGQAVGQLVFYDFSRCWEDPDGATEPIFWPLST